VPTSEAFPSAPASTAPRSRTRNRRGEGARLREEILEAAARILDRAGGEEAVTLRAVAREVGIAAPSIYHHFPDREAILAGVMDAAFGRLVEVLSAGIAEFHDPVDRLRAGCLAYLRFAAEQPHQYRVLFGRTGSVLGPPVEAKPAEAETAGLLSGMQAFELLVDAIAACVAAGRSTSTDPFSDAVGLWVALHGLATLRDANPLFPWPDVDGSVETFVHRLALITAAPALNL
jgi:AcrR family transcriptional regulator